MVAFLHRLGQEGWIYVQQTEVADKELESAPEDKLQRLLADSATQPVILSPYVTFTLAEADVRRFHDVAEVLFPGLDLEATRKNNIRDILHVATAIRSCATGFVTNDRRLLAKAQAITEAFNGFRILNPQQAVDLAMQQVRTTRKRHSLEPARGPLPQWPEEESASAQ